MARKKPPARPKGPPDSHAEIAQRLMPLVEPVVVAKNEPVGTLMVGVLVCGIGLALLIVFLGAFLPEFKNGLMTLEEVRVEGPKLAAPTPRRVPVLTIHGYGVAAVGVVLGGWRIYQSDRDDGEIPPLALVGTLLCAGVPILQSLVYWIVTQPSGSWW